MTNDNPCVSIGMPVYNGELFLREALDSILAQTFKDFELIISDNASTDATSQICREYADKDKRIRYYCNEQNLGGAPNYNIVYNLSRGKFFKWASHDDLHAPEFIERCVEVLEQDSSVVLSYTRTVAIDEQGKFLESYPNKFDVCSPKPHERFRRFHDRMKSFERCDPVFGMIRSSQLRMTPVIGSYVSSDMVLLGELALLGKFHEVPEDLFFRRHHPQMSVKAANIDYDTRLYWFNTNKKGKLIFPRWRLFLEYHSAINRVEMGWYSKQICRSVMWLRFMEKWQPYVKELIINAARLLNITSIDFWGMKKALPRQW